jgi:hypothetical protein
MLIATITTITVLLFFGGPGGFSFDMFKAGIKDHVADRGRAKEIIAITKDADKEVKAFTKDLKKASKRLVTLNSNYNVTRDELNEFLDEFDQHQVQFQERIVDLRFQARDLMTPEEWQAVYGATMEKPSE